MEQQPIPENKPAPNAAPNKGPSRTTEDSSGLTIEDKELGLTAAEKQRRVALTKINAENPQQTIPMKQQFEQERENELRELHLAQNPQHRTIVDNNPMKVMVFVNTTSHSVPPGPITVADFKRMTKLTGAKNVSLNGRALNSEHEELKLIGGESFFSEE